MVLDREPKQPISIYQSRLICCHLRKMNKALILFILLMQTITMARSFAKEAPDTVYTGIYFTSIHDIDFRQKEYTANLWLWLKYKNKDFDFLQNLEVPMAKTTVKSYSTIDSTDGLIYILMKLQCVMKDSWKVNNFPFDQQKLQFSIENSQYDSGSLVFKADTEGKHFDPRFTLNGWMIDSFTIATKTKAYETNFGDEELDKPHSEYSAFRVNIVIQREAMGLFWKMFLGMYVSFLIAFIGFYIHPESVESRFGLGVGSVFAVVGNKYIIDSALPESSSFTLVDSLHGLTLICIFVVIVSAVYSLNLIKKGKQKESKRLDRRVSNVLLVGYLVLNIWFIWQAATL